MTYHRTVLHGLILDPAELHISHFLPFSLFFLSTKSTPEDNCVRTAAVRSFGAAFVFNFIFSRLPSFLLGSGGFGTRFSGLFGQVERDPEEAEFQIWAGLRLHFHCLSHSRPSGSRQHPASWRKRRRARFRLGVFTVKFHFIDEKQTVDTARLANVP